MTIRNLDCMFRPRSVALVGASEELGSVGRTVAENLFGSQFAGPIWLVNPNHKELFGRTSYANVEALPEAPDLGVIATPPGTVPGIIRSLGDKGCRAAVVITAGIRGELAQQMLEAARPYNLRILGSNCIGLIVPGARLNASFAQAAPEPGKLALLSQSGALLTSILDWAVGRQVGFSHMVSLGNMDDVDFGDMLDYLAGDVSSNAILLYMEAVKHAPKFMSAARRAARAKPVIVVKTGRHSAGAKAAASHTGALAGSDAVYEAAFRRAGLLRVYDLDELFVASEMAERVGRISGENLAILTNGGGAGVLAADRVADLQGQLAELSPGTMAALDKLLPPTWSKGNPVDIIGDAGPERYGEALEILLADERTDAILAINCPTALASSEAAANAVVERIEAHRIRSRKHKPVIACWLGENAAQAARKLFAERGIPSFTTPSRAVQGFMHLVRYTRAQEELMQAPPALSRLLEFQFSLASEQISSVLKNSRSMLSEPEAKGLLETYGIPIVPTYAARDSQEVRKRAEEILREHEACVLKIISDDITHKSDVGGVRLDIGTADLAAEAAEEMLELIRRTHPNARIEGISVQPMIRSKLAHELIIGMTEDPTFGPVIMFGAGGTAVEVTADTAMALPPLDLKLAHDLIRQTRIYRLLKGYRDRPAADLDAIALTLVKVSYLVSQHPEIRELDINPLLADDKGVVALDARVRVEDEREHPRTQMAIRPYPRQWERWEELAELGKVFIRPIRPDDEHLYEAMIKRMDAGDLRLRFFVPQRHMSRKFLARLTQIDYGREIAFAALSPSRDEMLGVVRFFADPDYRQAEYAVMVRSDLKGKGLGWLLMQHLIAYARAEKLQTLYGTVMQENTTMLKMCRELGFKVERDPEDTTCYRVTLDLSADSLKTMDHGAQTG